MCGFCKAHRARYSWLFQARQRRFALRGQHRFQLRPREAQLVVAAVARGGRGELQALGVEAQVEGGVAGHRRAAFVGGGLLGEPVAEWGGQLHLAGVGVVPFLLPAEPGPRVYAVAGLQVPTVQAPTDAAAPIACRPAIEPHRDPLRGPVKRLHRDLTGGRAAALVQCIAPLTIEVGLAVRADRQPREVTVDLLDSRPFAFQLEGDLPTLGVHLVGVLAESLLLDRHLRRHCLEWRVIGVAGAAFGIRPLEQHRQAFASRGFAPGSRQRVTLRLIQLPETRVAFFGPRFTGVGLGQLDGSEDALVVVTAVGAMGTIKTRGNGGFTQRAFPHTCQVGSVGEQGRAGEGDDSEGLEHGYRTSGCLIKAVRVMGSVRGFQRARPVRCLARLNETG